MKKKHKKLLVRIILSAVLFGVIALTVKLLNLKPIMAVLLYLAPYLVAGYDVLLKAVNNIKNGQIFDENFLMCIATVGAFCIGEYPEAVFVMVLYQAGELFQSIAVGKSRKSISALMNIKPEEARILREGEEIITSPEEVSVGEILIVRAGEKIPLDGIIVEGEGELDTSALTGESLPRSVSVGDKVTGGCINLNGTLKIEAMVTYSESTVSKILELVEQSSAVKSKTDRFITRFASYYTPAVCICAMLLFLVPSLVTGEWSQWLGRALVFLVISCPCALVISVPLSYFGGLGAASKNGILIKGACYLEALAETECVVFDKTGTLTKGSFKVCEEKCLDERLYGVAATLEADSNHPVAKAVYEYCAAKCGEIPKFDSKTEKAGMGILAINDGKEFFAGNARLVRSLGINTEEINSGGSIVYVGDNERLYGYFTVKDEIKESSANGIKALKRLGVKQTVMLSGDRKESVNEIASELSLDTAIGELMPADKVGELEKILALSPKGKTVAYVGDGINDAPVLTRADIGISMGAMGSDAAIEAADVVLMDDDPKKVADAVKIAKKTKSIVIQNIVFALGVKILFMVLGALDIAGLWLAVFADVGVSVIAILNAMRTLKIK